MFSYFHIGNDILTKNIVNKISVNKSYFSLDIVLMHLVQTFLFTPLTALACKLILNFRKVAMLEWLRAFPDWDPRPQMSQTLDMDLNDS